MGMHCQSFSPEGLLRVIISNVTGVDDVKILIEGRNGEQ